jgi:hypothetical protein
MCVQSWIENAGCTCDISYYIIEQPFDYPSFAGNWRHLGAAFTQKNTLRAAGCFSMALWGKRIFLNNCFLKPRYKL